MCLENTKNNNNCTMFVCVKFKVEIRGFNPPPLSLVEYTQIMAMVWTDSTLYCVVSFTFFLWIQRICRKMCYGWD